MHSKATKVGAYTPLNKRQITKYLNNIYSIPLQSLNFFYNNKYSILNGANIIGKRLGLN